jgi:hypothetical protein
LHLLGSSKEEAMRKASTILVLVSMLFAAPLVGADDHLVTRGAADRRLSEATAERARNVASLDALLRAPGADKAAALAGIDLGRARQALPQLSDADLSDLALRAAALKADPVAGYQDATDALIFVMVFAVAVLVILEVAQRR